MKKRTEVRSDFFRVQQHKVYLIMLNAHLIDGFSLQGFNLLICLDLMFRTADFTSLWRIKVQDHKL